MNRKPIYVLLYAIIIYGVYFISNLTEFAGGFVSFIYTIRFWLLFIILTTILIFKYTSLNISNVVAKFLFSFFFAIVPIFITIVGFRINNINCEKRLNELGYKAEQYYLKNKKYPETINEISTSFSRFIKSPYLLLPIPQYKYETDSNRQVYSITVYEDWDGGHMISSHYKEAKWFD